MEILAPAGGMESLLAAVKSGADAVYLGLRELNARRGAQNFDREALLEAAGICNTYGVKIHLTLNTLAFDSELPLVRSCLNTACEAGIEAVLVQDLGVARLVQENAPGLRMHASTQMSVHSLEGVLQLSEMGFSRAVLARELSFEEIEHIAAHSPIEIEVFAHGALCMSLSGQCLLSSMAGGRSGNRGMCAQPCRLPFSCGGEHGCALSLKDMTLLTPDKVAALERAGVASLKIEGRMKRPEYVAAAVTAARAALRGEMPDQELLKGIFSRSGFTDGYYTGRLTHDMFGIREKEDVLASREALKASGSSPQEERRIPIEMELLLSEERPAQLVLHDEAGHSVQVEGPLPQKAQRRPTTEEDARRSLEKLGGTPFVLQQLSADIGPGLMLPASALNALRREGAEKLLAKRAAICPVPFLDSSMGLERPSRHMAQEEPGLRAALFRAEQFSPELMKHCQLAALYPEEWLRLSQSPEAQPYLSRCAVRQPPAAFDEQTLEKQLSKARAAGAEWLLCTGLAGIRLGKRLGFRLLGDFTLNVCNTLALEEYRALGVEECTLSVEMQEGKIASLGGESPRGIVSYGRVPLMTMRACPIRARMGCARCRRSGILTDRQRRRFLVSCGSGVPQLYNSEKLYLADKLPSFRGIDFSWLLFYEETRQEAVQVVRDYVRAQSPETMVGFTRGLYYRKVL